VIGNRMPHPAVLA